MGPRKRTPDVMGEVLAGAEPAAKPTDQAQKPARQQAVKPAKPIKATYYLSAAVIDRLEAARLRLRQMVGPGERGQVSKSLIVEAALEIATGELEAKGEKSQLASITARELAKQK